MKNYLLLLLLTACMQLCRAANPVGGGFLHAGLRGAYYNNANLAGQPAFTRKDPRIDFDWGTTMSPGGSRGRGFNALGTELYSIRWTGQFKTRFTERYAFSIVANDGIRLRIKPSTAAEWTLLINSFENTEFNGQVYADLDSTITYDIELDYRERSGPSNIRLTWSGPSFPSEVIDPAFEVSANWTTYEETTFADAFMNGRGNWEQTTLDTQGWPIGDGDFIVSEILSPYAPSPLEVGRMRLTFNGRADVSVFGNGFLVPGSYEYNAADNQSSAWVQGQDFGANVLNLRFRNTTRTGVAGGAGGVTNVKLMRPAAPNSSESLAADEIFHPAMRATFADRLTGLRFQRVNDQARTWTERTQPWWPYQGAGHLLPFVFNAGIGAQFFGNSRMAHEYEIMLCNETGCDYYVTIPHLASITYIRNLALLIRYGSDANGVPYETATANPYYPPLNPNLRVYIEIANELWNFLNRDTYAPYGDYRELIEDYADESSPEFQILNFDNLPMTVQPDGYYVNNYVWVRRYWALNLALISNEFRGVFGNGAMPGTSAQPRIRPYLGYQYANANQTAEIPFEFLDNYFNNAAGSFVGQPHPVSYYLYAAGGAGYYGSGNPTGATAGLAENLSFENPSPAPWTISGPAGIVANVARTPAITGQTIGALRNNLSAWLGMRFTVGAEPVWAYEFGRYVHSGNNRSHALVLVRDDGQLVTYAQEIAGGAVGSYNYSRCVPVLLAANTSYILLSREESGYDTFGENAAVTSVPGITVQGATSATQINDTSWNITGTTAGSISSGPVNLRVATASALGNPDAPRGSQVAYIARQNNINGALQTQFIAPANGSGTYALAFRAVQRTRNSYQQPDTQTLRITANGADITYRGINGQPQTYSPNFPWQRISYWIGDYFFTETFTVTPGQPVTIRIEGTADAGDQLAFIDDIQITSADAIFAGGIPDTGEATGQPSGGDYIRGLRMDARWAEAYGLHHMTYEHGWSIGGDSGASPIQEFAKYRDPRTAQTMIDAVEIFHRAGGANMTLGTYSAWPLFSETLREEGALNPTAYPLVQGLDAAWNSLAHFPDNGVSLPGRLDAANRAIGFYTSENRVDAGEWISWNLIVRERATYQMALDLAGGGTIRLILDDATQLFQGPAAGAQNFVRNLSPGLHTLKIKALTGTATFTAISVIIPNTPSAPILDAIDGDGYADLGWAPVAGATGYTIRYGPDPGFPNETIDVGAATYHRVGDLQNGAAYYFTVIARNENGPSLPSNEMGITPFGDNQIVDLVAWDFAGRSGDASVATATVASFRIGTSLLSRGFGFGPADWAPNDCFLGASVNWGQTLQQGVANQHFVEFTLTPRHGRRVSIQRLTYRPGFQNFTGAENDPRGTGIAWRTTGQFSTAIPVIGQRTASMNNNPLFTADLSAISELQNVTAPITFRIYFHGMGPYEGAAIGGPGNDITVTGSLVTPPLTAWRALHNLAADGSEDDDAPDGISNLAKYAFNLAPNEIHWLQSTTISGLPFVWLQPGGAQLTFQYLRRRATSNPGITYTPRRSSDLLNWTPIITEPQIETIDPIWERVTLNEPTAQGPGFFQVQIVHTP